MMTRVIAIDGPAAAGKSTVSRKLAAELELLYVDSGALYRIVTWQCMEQGVDTSMPDSVAALCDELNVEFSVREGAVVYSVGGYEPSEELRTPELNKHVSPVATVPGVRARVTEWLRGMRELGALVVEGRDIGSAVFPDAEFKFYLDADSDERARRRHVEENDKGIEGSKEEVKASLLNRDRIDSSRKTAPLKVAGGAVVVDTTYIGIDEVIELVLQHIKSFDSPK